MPLIIVKDDITTLSVDAIVNAANQELKNYARRRGGGVEKSPCQPHLHGKIASPSRSFSPTLTAKSRTPYNWEWHTTV